MGEDRDPEKTGEGYKPPEGFDGNLTAEQEEGLKKMWKKYFEVVKSDGKGEVAGVKADESADDDEGDDEGGEGEDAFKGKAKDDAGKDEQAKQREKKELAAMLGQYGTDEFRAAFWNASRGELPDALMLRFLRARKWDVERGFAMMAAALKWRIEQGVAEIKEKGEEGLCEEEGFRLQYDTGKSYIMGTDKNDRPVVYIHVAKHHPKDQSQKSLQRFTIFNMELARHLLTPRANGQGTLIFDMTNFGLSNMDWQCIRFIMECFEARYPETLGLCLVHKAPMVFNAIWAILKPLLDPVVRSKIDFTKNDADLAKHIPEDHIKRSMGGQMDWEWHYSGPAKGENKRMEDDKERKERMEKWEKACKEWEELTELWIDGDKAAGQERNNRHNRILMIRHLDLDPYVRGQTVYSRNGTNVGDGTVRWRYPDGDEEFGTSYNKVRKELGIEGECPKNGHAGGPVAAAQQELDTAKDPDEAAAFAAGKSGGGIGKLKRRASNSFSVLTPGPSESEAARAQAEKDRNRLTKELDKAKEEQKKQEEEQKRQEQEKMKQEKQANESGGMLGSITSSLSGMAVSAGSMANSTAHAASNYVPSAVGGDKLKEMTAPADDGGGDEK